MIRSMAEVQAKVHSPKPPPVRQSKPFAMPEVSQRWQEHRTISEVRSGRPCRFSATQMAKATDEGTIRKAKTAAFQHLNPTKQFAQPCDLTFSQAPLRHKPTLGAKLYVFFNNEIVFIWLLRRNLTGSVALPAMGAISKRKAPEKCYVTFRSEKFVKALSGGPRHDKRLGASVNPSATCVSKGVLPNWLAAGPSNGLQPGLKAQKTSIGFSLRHRLTRTWTAPRPTGSFDSKVMRHTLHGLRCPYRHNQKPAV